MLQGRVTHPTSQHLAGAVEVGPPDGLHHGGGRSRHGLHADVRVIAHGIGAQAAHACFRPSGQVQLAVTAQLHARLEGRRERRIRHGLLWEVLELVQYDLTMHHHKPLHFVCLPQHTV